MGDVAPDMIIWLCERRLPYSFLLLRLLCVFLQGKERRRVDEDRHFFVYADHYHWCYRGVVRSPRYW